MEKSKIVISEQVDKEVRGVFDMLREIADVSFMHISQRDVLVRKELEDVSALLVSSEPVNEELLDLAPKLKIVSRYGVGYDRVDVEACTKRKIYVTNTPGILSSAVAEFTIGLMIAVSKEMIAADKYVRTKWENPNVKPLPLGRDLFGKTLGIIGLGRIGYEVALRAKAFGMKLVYHDEIKKDEIEGELGIEYAKLTSLLRKSDYVSLNVPLTPSTKILIGKEELRIMKPTAFLINTSRGPVVDETVLCEALEKKWIAGVGLDVFQKEPLPRTSPLVGMDNVVLSPHIASHTLETRKSMASKCMENIWSVLKGRLPPNPVPEQKLKNFISSDASKEE